MELDECTLTINKNLKLLRQTIEDIENMKVDQEDFEDSWYADNVELFYTLRKSIQDFMLIKNADEQTYLHEQKLAAEQAAAYIEYEIDSGYTLDLPAFLRFCIAVESIYQMTSVSEDVGLEDIFMTTTIPTSIK
jgi:hypothetical protein